MASSKSDVLRVAVSRLPHAVGLDLPNAATVASAGSDLRAANLEPMVLEAGTYAAIPTGIAIQLQPGWEAQIRPRSGLAARFGVTVLNSPGTIDADYRGEIRVLLINHGEQAFTILRGDRIAQIVVAPVERVEWFEVDGLDDSPRGTGGFGSTGRR